MSTPLSDRRAELLNYSKALLRTRGYNAFSHRDLAELVGVKSSSVHYYFPTKEDIGLALIEEYRSEVMGMLSSLGQMSVAQRLHKFASMFIETSENANQWCVAGMLASDFGTLGNGLQEAVRKFFYEVEGWLSIQAQELQPDLKPEAARCLGKAAMAIMEGALLLARSQGEPQRVAQAAEIMKQLFVVK